MKKICFFLIIPLVLLFTMASSCNKETEVSMDFLISINTGPLEVGPGMSIKSAIYKGKGPLATDMVSLVWLNGSGRTYEYPIDVLTSSYFTFTIQEGFRSGVYAFNIKRGDKMKFIANVEYVLKESDVPDGIDESTTVYGTVSCGDSGIPGVAVSDGYEIVLTDADGMYQLKSQKKNGYVFISVPSGYDVPCDGTQPQFFKHLDREAGYVERQDFSLYDAGDQTDHTVLLLGDMHLAGGKNNDRKQFANVTAELNSYLSEHGGDKVYAFTLGDMTWDLYWYDRNYCFAQYVNDINAVKNLPVFNTIGNHDHDMKTSVNGAASGWAAVDWDTASRFRSDLGPNYYSVNIGKMHYIVVDNIFCTNTTGGAAADRVYSEKVSEDNLKWIVGDLKNVAKSTPITVLMHAQLFNQDGKYSLANASSLLGCFSGYSDVTFVTGHSHKMWTIKKSSFKEHNSGAVCGCWWWAGRYNETLNIAQDGAPSGYRVMEVKGAESSSYFKGIMRGRDCQFRSYDLNETYIPTSVVANAGDYGNYSVKQSSNRILINVWDYDEDWKVEVTENGVPLVVTRETLYDPLFILAYVGERYGSKYSSVSFAPFQTNHMFTATSFSATSTLEIKVTDDEGRVYTETMTRPKKFSLDAYK